MSIFAPKVKASSSDYTDFETGLNGWLSGSNVPHWALSASGGHNQPACTTTGFYTSSIYNTDALNKTVIFASGSASINFFLDLEGDLDNLINSASIHLTVYKASDNSVLYNNSVADIPDNGGYYYYSFDLGTSSQNQNATVSIWGFCDSGFPIEGILYLDEITINNINGGADLEAPSVPDVAETGNQAGHVAYFSANFSDNAGLSWGYLQVTNNVQQNNWINISSFALTGVTDSVNNIAYTMPNVEGLITLYQFVVNDTSNNWGYSSIISCYPLVLYPLNNTFNEIGFADWNAQNWQTDHTVNIIYGNTLLIQEYGGKSTAIWKNYNSNETYTSMFVDFYTTPDTPLSTSLDGAITLLTIQGFNGSIGFGSPQNGFSVGLYKNATANQIRFVVYTYLNDVAPQSYTDTGAYIADDGNPHILHIVYQTTVNATLGRYTVYVDGQPIYNQTLDVVNYPYKNVEIGLRNWTPDCLDYPVFYDIANGGLYGASAGIINPSYEIPVMFFVGMFGFFLFFGGSLYSAYKIVHKDYEFLLWGFLFILIGFCLLLAWIWGG